MTDETTYADYRASIKLLADEVEEGVREYEEDVAEAIWSSLDGSSWVIFNHRALKTIEFADNEPDEWKHYVSDDSSFYEIVQAYAYKSMEADIYDELRRRDVLDDLYELV